MIRKFKIENLEFRIKALWLCFLIALFFILYSLFSRNPAFAVAECITQLDKARVKGGLISATDVNNLFGSDTGQCVVDPQKAPFVPYKIPTYEDLKSMYFDQYKNDIKKAELSSDADERGLGQEIQINNKELIYVNGNVGLNNPIPASKTAVVFVKGDLVFSGVSQFTYGGNTAGIVFIVGGNVNIAETVSRIDAVIISSGQIRTAGPGCETSSSSTSTPLSVYGSLVSIYKNQAESTNCRLSANPATDNCPTIKFCRDLGADNSTTPAEYIYHQPKYLVILRNILSDTYQKWSEIQ